MSSGSTAGVRGPYPAGTSKVGLSRSAALREMPINGLRHPPTGDTSGWYIWGGTELSADPNFFEPVHVSHVEALLPEVVPYLDLVPGSRFLLAPGYQDVWFDPSLLDVEEV